MQRLRLCSVVALMSFGVLAWCLSGATGTTSVAQERIPRTPPAPKVPVPNPGPGDQDAFQKVFDVHQKHHLKLIKQKGIIGVGIMADPAKKGSFAIRLYTTGSPKPSTPKDLDGIPVYEQFLMEGFKPYQGIPGTPPYQTKLNRPIAIGVSVSNQETPSCYSGTLGCRIQRNSDNKVFTLSNNHVYADENLATVGDPIQQPSSGDDLCNPAAFNTRIGRLHHFIPINFVGTNLYDAAVSTTTARHVGVSTLPDGYGTPRRKAVDPVIGTIVQKYGRTTGYRQAVITAVNVTVTIGYTTAPATFINQIETQPLPGGPNLGAPGDSGSLVVTDNRDPVGLLFAGSATRTLLNPIRGLLDFYGADVDDGGNPPAVPSQGLEGKRRVRVGTAP